MSITNTAAVLTISTASESVFDKVYPKNGEAVPNWKNFQISVASNLSGFKKKSFYLYQGH